MVRTDREQESCVVPPLSGPDRPPINRSLFLAALIKKRKRHINRLAKKRSGGSNGNSTTIITARCFFNEDRTLDANRARRLFARAAETRPCVETHRRGDQDEDCCPNSYPRSEILHQSCKGDRRVGIVHVEQRMRRRVQCAPPPRGPGTRRVGQG